MQVQVFRIALVPLVMDWESSELAAETYRVRRDHDNEWNSEVDTGCDAQQSGRGNSLAFAWLYWGLIPAPVPVQILRAVQAIPAYLRGHPLRGTWL